LAAFRCAYAPDDGSIAAEFLAGATLSAAREARIDEEARRLIGAIRASASGIGGIEALLREYSLSTPEGLALMVLAEACCACPTPHRRPSDRGQARPGWVRAGA
jgi:RHH-type proline utilization regulon transcriptional repressor/proline dehydrogenase/delta 1-pyrroline-5-carboxylate dehydrogenase